jgi:hypothetical protein
VTADQDAAGLDLQVTYETTDRHVLTASAGTIAEGTNTYEATLDGADRILSITFLEEAIGEVPDQVELGLSNVTAGDPIDLSSWTPIRWRGSDAQLATSGSTTTSRSRPGPATSWAGSRRRCRRCPRLISPEISRSQGQSFSATVGAQRLDFRQVALADAFPSVLGDFVVVSTPALIEAAARIPEPGLALNEVWAMGDRDPRAALKQAGFIPGADPGGGPIIAALAQLPQSLAVGMNFATRGRRARARGARRRGRACTSRSGGGSSSSRRSARWGPSPSRSRASCSSSRG